MKAERGNHVTFRTVQRGDGTKSVEAHTPESTIPCPNRDELEALLTHYARRLFTLTTPNSQMARRKYVELIRPALRYYCNKFSVEVPDWLKNDDYYLKHMSTQELIQHFGTAPLRIKEFEKVKPVPGVVGADYPGKKPSPQDAEQQQGASRGAKQ